MHEEWAYSSLVVALGTLNSSRLESATVPLALVQGSQPEAARPLVEESTAVLYSMLELFPLRPSYCRVLFIRLRVK